MGLLDLFLKQIRLRSHENKKSFDLLYANECFGVCIGILRQELDTLLIVAYLIDYYNGNVKFNSKAHDLVKNSVEIGEWKFFHNGKLKIVSDKEMLEAVGWEKIVYEFGCGLIHLSNKHVYKEYDPVLNLNSEDREQIIYYLNWYHGYSKKDVTMQDIIEYLPKIYLKIFDNIEGHLSEIIELDKEVKLFD